jgi:cob(I)alamin adenosyltransferase
MKKGLLMLYTGSQTGTAAVALGQAFRAIGRGLKVCFIRFSENSSAFDGLFRSDPYKDLVEFHSFGKKAIDSDAVMTSAASLTQGWELAQEAITSGEFRMVVLEGLADLLKSNRLDEHSVVGFLTDRPTDLHVIATGGDAPESLIDVADLVTEVLETDRHRDNS